ncbi:MAG: hypothetical protein ACLTDS_08515 [Bianqueaceae bacterium]
MALLLVDEPEGIYYGGTVCAPIVREYFENILPYLESSRTTQRRNSAGTTSERLLFQDSSANHTARLKH